MAIEALDHVSILAADAPAVVDFYVHLLGFRETARRQAPGMEIRDLQRGTDHVEIIQPTEGDPPRSGGIKHVAFRSDDIAADFARFRESGARLLHEEVQRSPHCAYFFVRSPGGEWVEIIQYPEGGVAP